MKTDISALTYDTKVLCCRTTSLWSSFPFSLLRPPISSLTLYHQQLRLDILPLWETQLKCRLSLVSCNSNQMLNAIKMIDNRWILGAWVGKPLYTIAPHERHTARRSSYTVKLPLSTSLTVRSHLEVLACWYTKQRLNMVNLSEMVKRRTLRLLGMRPSCLMGKVMAVWCYI